MKKDEIAKQYIINWCWNKSYTAQNLFVRRLMDKGFTHLQIKSIIEVLQDTCVYCFDNDKSCYCIMDD